MLLRDLKMTPREVQRYFDECWLRLADGSKLHIQYGVSSQAQYDVNSPAKSLWFMTFTSKDHHPNTEHSGLSEFEAQAVLDHYLQLHGVTDEVA